MHIRLTALITGLLLILVGCGSPSGHSDTQPPTTPTPTNSTPSVDAGANQTVSEGATVSLDATASDPDGDSLTYAWTQTAGTSVSLSNVAIEDPNFTAPEVSASRITMAVEGNTIEVLQTTPRKTAQSIALELVSKPELKQDIDDQAAQSILALSWVIQNDNGDVCPLERQAYRLVHHDLVLQVRMLFVCPQKSRAKTLTANWLDKSPSDHFMFFDLIKGDSKQTQIIQRHQKIIRLPD